MEYTIKYYYDLHTDHSGSESSSEEGEVRVTQRKLEFDGCRVVQVSAISTNNAGSGARLSCVDPNGKQAIYAVGHNGNIQLGLARHNHWYVDPVKLEWPIDRPIRGVVVGQRRSLVIDDRGATIYNGAPMREMEYADGRIGNEADKHYHPTRIEGEFHSALVMYDRVMVAKY